MILTGSLCATPEEEDAASLVPTSTLEMLAAENISMKEDLELKLQQITEYKYIIQEYSDKLEAEIERNKLLGDCVDQIKQDKSFLANLAGPTQNKMQELVKDLTLQLTEKVEEITALKSVNRQLSKKLNL